METYAEYLEFIANQEPLRKNLIRVMRTHAMAPHHVAKSSGVNTHTISKFMEGKDLAFQYICRLADFVEKKTGLASE